MAATVAAVGPLARLDRILGCLITQTLSRLMVAWFLHDTPVDHPIWHHKQYQPHPALNQERRTHWRLPAPGASSTPRSRP
ncbi:hypothetical protein ACWD1Z_36445 [Streptomyces sp. NPDC002784]